MIVLSRRLALANGPVRSTDLYRECRERGVSLWTVERAADALGLVAVRFAGFWARSFPEHVPPGRKVRRPNRR